MKGLILFIGESFRSGSQGTRIRGRELSYEGQIKACNSHIDFFQYLLNTHHNLEIDVSISTYTTKFDNDLLQIYDKYLIQKNIYNDVIGLDNLFHKAVNSIDNINNYNFILYLRIDLFIKEHFYTVFNPYWQTIRFPTICWFRDCRSGKYPRVNDNLLFIPQKYFTYIDKITIGHEAWYYIIERCKSNYIETRRALNYDDLDSMINTYHDSDSEKDNNPLYYIVNRPENPHWHSEGLIFNKMDFI
jgi:hypothetical protein